MRQNATKEQWDAFGNIQRARFYVEIRKKGDKNTLDWWDVTIGRMIAFLGDDLVSINYYEPFGGTYGVKLKSGKEFINKELIDAGWEAVVYRANNLI